MSDRENHSMERNVSLYGMTGLFILGGLYLASLYNYLFFHSLAEMFSIIIAFAIFMFSWNSRLLLDNDYLLFLGISYLFIGCLDLVHTLAYKGMAVFPGYDANLPTQVWIAARYMESLSLLIAPLLLGRKIRVPLVFAAYGTITVIILASLFFWNVFPDCYIEGTGLTPFKKLSEYCISLILVGAAIILFRKRQLLDARVLRLLVASITITIAAELTFTLYISVYGLSNLIGHFLKIVSVYCIYRAIISTGLLRPYDILFREIKQSGESLRRERDFTKRLVETAQVIMVVLDTEGRIIQFNPYMEELSGYSLDEVKGKDWISTFVPEDERVRIDQVFSQAVGGTRTSGNVNRIMTKDGRELYVEWYDAKLTGADGNIVGLLSVGQDITARKQAEAQLKEYSENLERMVAARTEEVGRALGETEAARGNLDGIVRSVADGLIVTDSDNRIVMMNPAAEVLLGISLENAGNRLVEEVITEEVLRERLKKALDRKTTGDRFDFELPGENGGRSRIIRARTSVVPERAGGTAGIVTIMTDVTHEREVDRMKTEFVSTAAHELRTPLTSILGFSELLVSREDLTEDEKKKFLRYINEKSKHLNAIISDILDISRIEGGKEYPLVKDVFDIGELIGETVSQFKKQCGGWRFIVTLPEGPVELTADREKLQQVLRNLLGNAVKFSPEKSPITVTAKHSGDSYQISIRDEGIGMTPEQMEKIFDKFYRADMSTSAKDGTGLGMSIVKYIVEAHGGTVRVESEPGKGTEVRFTVPLL